MIVWHRRQSLSLVLCFILLLLTVPLDSGGAALYQAASMSGGSDYSGQGIPLTPEELQSLVAPIALYPDALLAQVLVAATYPDQVLVANMWVGHSMDLPQGVFIQQVSAQPWDPSVKGLTPFAAVLNIMSRNLIWTSQLGEAYHNQHSAVMAAVQALRNKAKTEEHLKSTPQMMLAQPSGDIITLQPGNPMMVVVPQYNPAAVYGAPLQTPNYVNKNTPENGLVAFGDGVAIGALSGTDWGWGNWSCNWYQGVANYRNYPYFGNHAWHGGYYGGYLYYGNHPYHDDANRPFSSQAGGAPPASTPPSAATVDTSASKHAFSVSGTAAAAAPKAGFPVFNAWSREGGGWPSGDGPLGWGPPDPALRLTAFSSWGSQAGTTFAIGGWGDRSASYRGWAIRGGASGWGIGGRSSGLHW
ncbi:MAG: DUF3300 domain-containing protein [Candidatus Korobacteraceae bacterium]|jgi:hypothetical protein